MYITKPKRTSSNGKTYETVLLRESYREDGKVKNRTIANLTHCSPADIEAMEFALKHKNHLGELLSFPEPVTLHEGLSVGAAWTVYQVAQRRGLEKALGKEFQGQLALYQVMARLIDQGSRLSAVRLAQVQALPDVVGMTRGFDEEDLYENLHWLTQQQERIETTLFRARTKSQKPDLFLYDVTSSYLEGKKNELAAYGYNRDGKKGKKQIVIGLLCDAEGEPVSVQVFQGNTNDVKTVADQIQKVAERFACPRVTFVGDRGMIKSATIQDLKKEGFHYITAITKPQIETLLKQGVIQMAFFDVSLFEVENGGVRYILRRNPLRADEIAQSRADKQRTIEGYVQKQNDYLAAHPNARVETAIRRVAMKLVHLKIEAWLRVEAEDRVLKLEVDEERLSEISRLDGCYVIRTDLSVEEADARVVHDRYKELAEVESAFRISKTGHLELRPIHVRTEESTRGHVFVVMLAYLIRRSLEKAWRGLNVTVEEGLTQLATLSSIRLEVKGKATCHKIPEPREQSRVLLQALNLRMPETLPHRSLRVVTKKKLQNQRITR